MQLTNNSMHYCEGISFVPMLYAVVHHYNFPWAFRYFAFTFISLKVLKTNVYLQLLHTNIHSYIIYMRQYKFLTYFWHPSCACVSSSNCSPRIFSPFSYTWSALRISYYMCPSEPLRFTPYGGFRHRGKPLS